MIELFKFEIMRACFLNCAISANDYNNVKYRNVTCLDQ